jgi:DNA-binding response OmpR family regulator
MTRCSALLVDDEPLILDLYSAALRHSGFTVHQASDPATARAICARARPDVICIDGRMIHTSGGNLARELIDGGSPVVVFTNDQALFDRPPAGVSGRLIKVNTRPAELGDRLREILAGVPERLR